MGETGKRIVSGLVLAALVIVTLFIHERFYSLPIFIVVLLFSLGGLIEFYRLVDRGEAGRPIVAPGLIAGFFITLAFYGELIHRTTMQLAMTMDPWILRHLPHLGLIVPFIFLLTAITLAWQVMFRPLPGTLYSVSVTVFGASYIAVALGHTFLYFSYPGGVRYLILVIVATVFTDIGAYFGGRWFGKHNAGLRVSPKKTYEGYVAGYLIGFLASALFLYGPDLLGMDVGRHPYMGPGLLVFFSGVISSLSVIGDLGESAIKRDMNRKDSASVIPGHGGFLDLYDALLFTLPAGVFFLRFIGVSLHGH